MAGLEQEYRLGRMVREIWSVVEADSRGVAGAAGKIGLNLDFTGRPASSVRKQTIGFVPL
jgi:hypothetical protein